VKEDVVTVLFVQIWWTQTKEIKCESANNHCHRLLTIWPHQVLLLFLILGFPSYYSVHQQHK